MTDSTKNRIYNFFENPQTATAKFTQVFIVLLILLSVYLVVLEFFYEETYLAHKALIGFANGVVLIAFTVEYSLRFFTAPRKGKFFVKPFNIIDFVAVFPNYLEYLLPLVLNTTAFRVLRLLRFARILRGFRLLRFGRMFTRVLRYQNTILQTITPVIALLVVLKAGIWILEYYGFWLSPTNLGELFAIIGFALGIILSQKIGVSYDKFIQTEEATVRLYATMRSLASVLDKVEPGLGTAATRKWAKRFLELLEDEKADNSGINSANQELYEAVSRGEQMPAELAMLHGDIVRDAMFCLSKKVRLMPKAYDTLLHQSTLFYLVLIAVFIPGITGMISVLLGTYILYGMYNLTQDFDSILGGEFNLLNIDISELKEFVKRG